MGLLDAFEADLRTPYGVVARGGASSVLAQSSSWNPSDLFSCTIVRTIGIIRTSAGSGAYRSARGSKFFSTKSYIEFTVRSGNAIFGLSNSSFSVNGGNYVGQDTNSIGFSNIVLYNNTALDSGTSTVVDTIGFAYDPAGFVYVSQNGIWRNGANPSAGLGGFTAPPGPLAPTFTGSATNDCCLLNTGGFPFYFTPPSGFSAGG